MNSLCTNVTPEDLSGYLDGHLPSDKQDFLDSHLPNCFTCHFLLKQFKRAGQIFVNYYKPDHLPSDDIWQSLSQKLPDICQLIGQDLSAYLDNELPLSAKEGVEEHLKQCSQCHENWQLLNKTEKLLNHVHDLPPGNDPHLWANVKERLNKDCNLIASELSLFLDQATAPLRHREITVHLLACPPCQKKFQQLSALGNCLRQYYLPDIEENFNLWTGVETKLKVVPLFNKKRLTQTKVGKRRLTLLAAAAIIPLSVLIGSILISPAHKTIQPVSAEVYLLESLINRSSSTAEEIAYENQ